MQDNELQTLKGNNDEEAKQSSQKNCKRYY